MFLILIAWFAYAYLIVRCVFHGLSFGGFLQTVAVLAILFIVLMVWSVRRMLRPAAGKQQAAPRPAAPAGTDSGSITFRVAGTTFDNDDGTSRQEILRHLKFGDEPWADGPEDLTGTLEETDYNGETAFAVLVEITLGKGFSIQNVDTKYIVTEDVKKTVLQITETALTGITVNGWAAAGDAMELTYTRIRFPEGVLPESIDYDVLDKRAWTYLQEYIYLNGKSIKQINEETDTSGYVFSTFPSTADEKYKLPVIIFENGNALELKFHNAYLQTVEGNLEITVKAGLYILVESTKYVVNQDICYQLSGDIWSDKNRTYTVTYYVNGEVYGEVEEYPYKTALVVRENVATDIGYEFSGWEYTATTGIIQDMEIYGYIKPIRYTITYHLNGGVNAFTNPIVYYVTDGEILLKDATKEGATFKGWYTSEDYATKVEKLSPEQLGDMELYALFEGGDTDNKDGCGSIVGIRSGFFALVGAAILLKKRKNNE